MKILGVEIPKEYARGWVIIGAALALCVGLSMIPVEAREDERIFAALLSAASTDETAVAAPAATLEQCREFAVYVVWSAGTNAGSVTIESAHDSTYAGTWAPLTAVAFSAANKVDMVQVTGYQKALRTRIDTAIGGGTVTTYVGCN